MNARFLALLLSVGCAAHKPWQPDHVQEAIGAYITTEDGAQIYLDHYPNPQGQAVLLCHGISSNRHFWDLDPEHSLALTLHDAGFDVWNLDLRGHGAAERKEDGKRQPKGSSIDDYGRLDLPAAIQHIQQQSGKEALHFVGHSMGGMVLAVYLASTPEPPLQSAVAVGSPLDFQDLDLATEFVLDHGKALSTFGKVPTPMGSRMLASMGSSTPYRVDTLLFNPDNMTPDTQREMLRHIVSPMSRGELLQLHEIPTHNGFVSIDEAHTNYLEAMKEVDVPMLFIAGRDDHIVNPDRVYGFYEHLGTTDKAFFVAGPENGLLHPYGHLDLGLGEHAPTEIYVPIMRWLLEHP